MKSSKSIKIYAGIFIVTIFLTVLISTASARITVDPDEAMPHYIPPRQPRGNNYGGVYAPLDKVPSPVIPPILKGPTAGNARQP